MAIPTQVPTGTTTTKALRSMKSLSAGSLSKAYAATLRDHLADGGEADLERAYALGRRAMGQGMGVLEFVALHDQAVRALVRERGFSEADARLVLASGRFLVEGLSPFEMAQRGFQEAITARRSLNFKLEEESRRIAHALHDDAGQILTSVHVALDEVATCLPVRSRVKLKRIHEKLLEIEDHLRTLSHELRPTVLDDLGLMPALRFLARGVAKRAGVEIVVEGSPPPRLRPPVEYALYRVAQEALRNATRHAGARRIVVHIDREQDHVRLKVEDDGRGFDVAAVLSRRGDRGLGLLGMRERLNAIGGQLAIDSAPGLGTEVLILVPLREEDHAGSASPGG